MSVGSDLKSAREAKKISLKTISDKTKIPVKCLESLEQDRFDVFPSQTYSKSFIRAYAKMVGLDQAVMTRQFNAQVQPEQMRVEPMNIEAEMEKSGGWRPAVDLPPVMRRPERSEDPELENLEEEYAEPFLREPSFFRKQKRGARDNKWAKWFVQAAAFVAAVGIAGATVYFGQIALNKIKWSHSSVEIGSGSSGVYTPIKVEDKYQHLILKGLDKAWVQIIMDDGKTTSEVDLEEGELRTYQAVRNFRLKIGNAGGVDIQFNGQSLGVLGVSGQVMELTLPAGTDTDTTNG